MNACLSLRDGKKRKKKDELREDEESSGSLPEGPRPIGVIPECDLSVSLSVFAVIGQIPSQSSSVAPHWLLVAGINAKSLVLYNEPQRRVKEDRRGSSVVF